MTFGAGFGASKPHAFFASTPVANPNPAPNPFGGFGKSSPGAAPAPAPTPAFGQGFGLGGSTNQTAPTAFGQAAQPSNVVPFSSPAFGTSQPTSGATQSTFGSLPFSTPQPAPSAFGSTAVQSFGASASAFGTSQPTNSFSAASKPGFGAALPAFGGQSSFGLPSGPQPTSSELVFPLGADTPFKTLPAHIQAAIVDAYKNYKKPVRDFLSSLARVQERKTDALAASIHQSSLAVKRLLLKYHNLVEGSTALHDQIKALCKNSLEYCVAGSQELKRKSVSSRYNDQNVDLLNSFLNQLSTKLASCSSQIKMLSFYYANINATHEEISCGGRGTYGQRIPVGPKQLVQLIQQQNDSLFSVAALIAEIHRDVSDLKRRYLAVLNHSDPFADADAKEESEKKRFTQRRRAEVQELMREKLLSNPKHTIGAIAAPNTGFGSGFGISAATAPTTSGFGATGTSGLGFGSSALASTPLNRSASVAPTAAPFSLNLQQPASLNALDLAKPNGLQNNVNGLTQPPSTPMPAASQKKNRPRR